MRHRPYALAPLVLTLAAAGCFLGGPETPLGHAAAVGDLVAMKTLLDAGADPNAPGAYRITPLAAAARAGHLDAIEVLLAHGADPHLGSGFNGWPPLLHALHKNQTAAAMRLLEAPSPPGKELNDALAMAAGYAQAEIVRALLARGADPRVNDGNGADALALATGGSFDLDWSYQGCDAHAATVRAILEAAPELRLRGPAGASARSSAERHGCGALLALLK